MTIRRRAITDEQKAVRRQALVDAAWMLFQTRPYDGISMADVAEAAGLAKGTLYLYFATKEELFLAVQIDQLNVWFDTVDAGLRALAGQANAQAVARLLCGSLDAQPGLARLFTILHTVLEQNVGYELIRDFKHLLHAREATTGALLETCLPFLAAGEGFRFINWAYIQVIGLYQLAHPADIVRQVIADEPTLAAYAFDFCRECEAMTSILLAGLEAARRHEKD